MHINNHLPLAKISGKFTFYCLFLCFKLRVLQLMSSLNPEKYQKYDFHPALSFNRSFTLLYSIIRTKTAMFLRNKCHAFVTYRVCPTLANQIQLDLVTRPSRSL